VPLQLQLQHACSTQTQPRTAHHARHKQTTVSRRCK
jgi:hypothetical protein